MENYSELKGHFDNLYLNEEYIEYFYNYNRENLRKNPELAKEVAEEALSICKKQNYEVGCAWSLLSLGWYYQDRCMYSEAIELHTRANEIFNNNNILVGVARASNALLADYTAIGMFDLAIENGLVGIEIAEKHGDDEILIPLIINTSMAYLDSKYYKECMELMKRLESVWHKIDYQNRIIIFNLLAEAELYYNNIEKSNEYCTKAYELIKENNLVVIEHDNLLISAEIKWKMGQYKEAEEEYERGVNLARKYKNILMVQKILVGWSKYYSFRLEYEKAEEKLLEAIDEDNSNFKLFIKEIYYELSQLYEKMNRYKDAYDAMQIFSQYERDIFNNKSSLWFAKLHDKKIIDDAKVYKVLYDEMNIISNIGRKITSNLKKESTLEAIYNEVNLLVDADIFGIAMFNEDINSLDYELFMERGEKKNYGLIPIDQEDSFGAYCLTNKTDVIINDIYKESHQYLKEVKLKDNTSKDVAKSAIFCSLMLDDKVIGILSVQNYKKNAYSINDLNKLKILTTYIAIALQNAKLYEEVEFLATHDSLTGVLNRREILNKRKKYPSNELTNHSSTGIIMLDIDHFKSVNDKYGHLIGDYVLVEVVNVIKTQIRSTDFVGRYGGEEFLILLPNTSIKDARSIGERIRLSIKEKVYMVNDITLKDITCSIGVCEVIEGDDVSFFKGIKCADDALYNAKDRGRNMVVEYLE
ncbi:MAG: sensor domain-containing diguanylate cyclase [Romboutsia sp.]|uniref:sensor domain-containing diguanylate cyclase n=1 Tax=Romboutsia sp. TaxID=1965302 RepID=UPI003F3BFC06